MGNEVEREEKNGRVRSASRERLAQGLVYQRKSADLGVGRLR